MKRLYALGTPPRGALLDGVCAFIDRSRCPKWAQEGGERIPGSREAEAWFSDAPLAQLALAETGRSNQP
jgi:hypothetical protein